MYTCSELRVSRCLPVCAEPLKRANAKPERGWKLLSLWQQLTTYQTRRNSGDILGRPHSSIQTSIRRLHVNLGDPNNNVLKGHLQHAHATQQTLEAARNFECPACVAAEYPRVARQPSLVEVHPPFKNIAMDVQELPKWTPGERVKTLLVVSEGSSVHAVVPFGDNDTETSQTPQT